MIRIAALVAALSIAVVLTPAKAEIGIVSVTSRGGIEAWLYEDRTIPIVTIAASFSGGASLDAEDRIGATSMMTTLLDEGAGDLDATAFARAREALASPIGFSTSDDAVTASAMMLTESRDATVELLRLALTEPRFDPEAVERVRGQTLASLRMSESDPNTVAGRALFAKAFPGHPYGRPTEGTLDSVAEFEVEDLREAHRAALVLDRLHVAVVGAIGPDELGPLLDRLFGGLPETGPELPPMSEPTLSGTTTVIDLDIPQSVVVLANAGLLIDDADLIPAIVMDNILGGSSNSRLAYEMRERRGLTYGVYTYLHPLKLAGLYMGSFSSSNERVAEALDILRAEWTRMAEEGVTEEELRNAKRYLTGEYSLRYEGNSNIATQLLGLQVTGRDIDFVNRRNDLVEAVTAEDVARVARRLLQPEALTSVIVGRPELDQDK